MHRKIWITSVLALALMATAILAPVASTPRFAEARQNGNPLVFLKDGDLWSWTPGASNFTQLSTWGYNQRPVLSPNGAQIAYNSWATITIEAIGAGQPAMGLIPSNIWVMDPRTGDAFRAADQPPGAVFNANEANNVVMRGTPAWSPDGTRLAWSELLAPEYRYQLVVFDVNARTTAVVEPNLPSPFADGGFIPMHEVKWGGAGIAVINVAVNSTSSDFEETLLLYNPTGGLRRETVIGSSATEFLFVKEWMTYNGQEYFGLVYPSGKRFLLDPATGDQQEMPALPELYSTSTPNNSATVFVEPFADDNDNLSAIWSAVYPNRQDQEQLDFGANPDNITISPDGQTLAYVSDMINIWQNGQKSTIPNTSDSLHPWNVSVVWGPTAWRVRTDWPPDGGTGGGPVACFLPPRLAAGTAGQVTPGLPNILRSQPRRGSDSLILGQIPGGGVFNVLNGPICDSEGRYWWQVNYQGTVGWTPEGEAGIYWLQPYVSNPPPVTCNLSPRLTVGGTAYVTPGLPNLLRSQPRRGSDSVILGRIPGNGFFTVISGPQCGPEGRYWWQVQYGSLIGWTAEGEGSTYWLVPFGCFNSPVPRLAPGMVARVTPGDPNRLRSAPGSNNSVVGQVPGGGVFTVLSGPQCGPEGWTWWRVQYGSTIGWTAEGQGSTYWLEPYGYTPPPPPPPVTCGPAPRLQVGVAGRVTPGQPNILRSQPRRGSDSAIIGEIPGTGVFSVLAGPQCGPEGRYWWQINYQGLVGWTPEGQGSIYWLEPYPGDGPPPSPVACTLQPRLTVGAAGYVLPGPSNVLRSQPYRDGDSQVIGQIPGSAFFRVLSGPQCDNEGINWWQVNYQGVVGWTGESQGSSYWVAPFVCVNSGPTRLVPGITARVTPGEPNVLRSQPGTGSGSAIIGEIPGGGQFVVLSGPQCGSENRIWWQVQYGSLIGWTAEGERGEYWLEPIG